MKMEAMKTFFFSLILFGLFGGTLLRAQQTVPLDSLTKKPVVAASPDSLGRASLPRAISLIDTMMVQDDSLASPVFQFSDLLRLNYNGLADVFRTDPGMQGFDFLEMGLPRFVSALHLWPQQTRFVLDDLVLNDPLTGMFNTRLLYPDALQRVVIAGRTLSARSPRLPQAAGTVRLESRELNPEKPYTRIMYREGDFGYTDLDITFAERLGQNTLLRLGGINRDYDPNNYRGTHYRGSLLRQLTPHVLGSFSYRKSSENVYFRDVYGTQFGAFRYNEIWEYFKAEVQHVNDSLKTDWAVRAWFNDTRRQYRYLSDNSRTRLRFDRLVLQGEKRGAWRQITWRSLLRTSQVRAWGSVYDRQYTDSRVNWQTTATVLADDSLRVTAQTALRFQWGQPVQVEPALQVLWNMGRFLLHASASRYARFPSLHERFFSYRGITANRNLAPETHRVLQADAAWMPTTWSRLKGALHFHAVSNEIGFNGQNFFDRGSRDFTYAVGQAAFRWFKFDVRLGGQLKIAGTTIGPQNSGFAQLHYRDRWIHGHMRVDAVGTVRWYGARKNVAYQPFAERFYRLPGQNDGFVVLSYKVVATVKDAHLFMEMDNPLATQYTIINGYPELYRRVRFGVSWVLWN